MSSPELFSDSLPFEGVHIKAVGLCRQDNEGHHSDVAVGRLEVVVQSRQ